MFGNWLGNRSQARRVKSPGRPVRLRVEALEDRTLPSSYTAATVSDLIADINAANTAGGSNTIALTAGTTFALTAVNNTTDGATGLPQIAANDNLIILGNGATIARSTAAETPAFRLFDVAGTASLSLSNLTLQGGLALGPAGAAGGAIYNQGVLDLNGVIVQGNSAQGSAFGQPAEGGGIYSTGALTLEGNSIVRNNQALGGNGMAGATYYRQGYGTGQPGGNGGDSLGGGVYVGGGTAAVNAGSLSGNAAQGGSGGAGGSGYWPGAGGQGGNGLGGGLYVGAGTVLISGVSLSGNTAQGGLGGVGGSATSGGNGETPGAGGHGGNGGNGLGGGLSAAGGTVTLLNDSVTMNTARGGAGGLGGTGKPRGATGSAGLGDGGGLYIDAAVLAYLDAYTQSNFRKNHASTADPDIDGSYSTYP
jgi:hypothetical protein